MKNLPEFLSDALISKKVKKSDCPIDIDELFVKRQTEYNHCIISLNKTTAWRQLSRQEKIDYMNFIVIILDGTNSDKILIKKLDMDNGGTEEFNVYSDYCNDGESDFAGWIMRYKGVPEFTSENYKIESETDPNKIIEWFKTDAYT